MGVFASGRKTPYHRVNSARYCASQQFCPLDFRSGSWLRENAGMLRRRRMVFSSVRCSFLLVRGSPLSAHRCGGAEISKTPRFLRFWCAGHVSPFVLLCVEQRMIWGPAGIGFYRFLIRTRFCAVRVIKRHGGRIIGTAEVPQKAD